MKLLITCCYLLLFWGSIQAQTLDVPTIFFNGPIFTADTNAPVVEAVAIEGQTIIAVGSLKSVQKIAGKSAKLYDLKGASLMPGMIDSHLHGAGRGTFLVKAHLADKWLPLPELANFAQENWRNGKAKYGDCFKLTGMNLNYWSDPAALSAIFEANPFQMIPVALRGMDGHTGWANKAMLEKAGITAEYIRKLPADKQHLYGHDAQFVPNGLLFESAMGQVMKMVPSLNEAEQDLAGQAALRYFNSVGLTGVADLACEADLPLYRRLSASGKLSVRVAAYPQVFCDQAIEPQIKRMQQLRTDYKGVRNLSIAGVKIFADGVVEYPTQTAALSRPYLNTGKYGDLEFQTETFARFCIEADKADLAVHVHAIGDRAITKSLNGFQVMRLQNGTNQLPHTITHLQFVLPSDWPRFKELGILASFQLYWAVADTAYTRLVEPYLDPQLYQWQYPARSMHQAGATVAGASDWPVSSANPFEAMFSAETRRGETSLVLNANEAMSRMDMLYAYTINAAKALRLEQQVGSIQVGKKADLITVDHNVLTASPDQLKRAKVLWTMLDGQEVYRLAE
jgi:predicted amidohydrolase YtcJ